MAEIVTLLSPGQTPGVEFNPEFDCQLVATRCVLAFDATGVTLNPPSDQSIVLSWDKAIDYQAISGFGAPAKSKAVISFGGDLPFPVQLRKGESVFFSSETQAYIQLWLADVVGE